MAWQVTTYQLRADPSRHRVAIWIELRRLGAVPLQKDVAEALERFADQAYQAREDGGSG